MIDRINNQKYYDYAKVNQQKRETTESAEFSLNMGKEGVIYEKGQQKKTAKSKDPSLKMENQDAAANSSGVKLEISDRGYGKSAREKRKMLLLEEVKKYASLAVDFLKSVWDKIWNDHTEPTEFPEILEEQMEQKYGTEETGLALYHEMAVDEGQKGSGWFDEKISGRLSDRIADSIYTQEEIRQIFRRGNQKEIEDFLSNHGEKHLAKNTELLTQYDRKGSIVGISSSDKDLILHGSRNQIKL